MKSVKVYLRRTFDTDPDHAVIMGTEVIVEKDLRLVIKNETGIISVFMPPAWLYYTTT